MSLLFLILGILTTLAMSTLSIINCKSKEKKPSQESNAKSADKNGKKDPKCNFDASAMSVATTNAGSTIGKSTAGDVGDYESCPDMTPEELAKVKQ